MVSRFTQDIRAVDVALSQNLQMLIGITTAMLERLIVIMGFSPIYVIPGIALAVVAYYLGRVYMAAQLSTKR